MQINAPGYPPGCNAAAAGVASLPARGFVGDANDLAQSAAAVGLLETGTVPVETALTLSLRAGRILRQNLVWAQLYNGLIIPAAIMGYVHPLLAAVAMATSSIPVSLNALRAGWFPGRRQTQPETGPCGHMRSLANRRV